MATLIQDEQLTEHSIREKYDDGDDGGTSLLDVFSKQFRCYMIEFHIDEK